eukprot:Nitzschia sp. Nitz4//scaffold8_size234185//54904//55685//NITZ4_001242-RA/size234185-snap-gene-0.9-mRNA-1//1//CDS//3329559761//2245//frame0
MKGYRVSLLSAAIVGRSSAFFASPVVSPGAVSRLIGGQQGVHTCGLSTTSRPNLPVMANEDVMSPKAHGTSDKPVMENLRWNCDSHTADKICNFNRHYAEYSGYWETTNFLEEIKKADGPVQFYDSVTGKLLFTAPIGRTKEDFVKESMSHGWPSFRDEEVNWEHVRCLRDGECVSTTGTHLGHNIPDGTGNRYCINLVSVAGQEGDDE